MLDELNNLVLLIADPLLGWLLYFPQGITLLLIALLTAVTLTGVRLFTTDQKYLKNCKNDKKRLKKLIREAKKKSDKESLARYRQTMGQIGLKSMGSEIKPLMASIVPIAIFSIWAFARIAYIPPQAEKEISMKMYFPISAIGSYAHIVPIDGINTKNGWIQSVSEDILNNSENDDKTVLNGVAEWKFQCDQKDGAYNLLIRHQNKDIIKKLIVDGKHYTEPIMPYGKNNVEIIEFNFKEFKLFGMVPGIEWLMLAPWMMAYLLIVLPLSFILKPVFRIY